MHPQRIGSELVVSFPDHPCMVVYMECLPLVNPQKPLSNLGKSSNPMDGLAFASPKQHSAPVKAR